MNNVANKNHQKLAVALITIFCAAVSQPGFAHVPYLEGQEFSSDEDFKIDKIRQSKAMYAWLETDDDVDQFVMDVTQPTRIYLSSNIPYCSEYEEFSISYALTGPGLPEPAEELPVKLAEGHGAVVVHDKLNGVANRSVMYEPYSARMYWRGIQKTVDVEEPGEYRMIVWNNEGKTGDYIAVIGKTEEFTANDWRLAAKNAPQINRGEELHVSCPDLALTADRKPLALSF